MSNRQPTFLRILTEGNSSSNEIPSIDDISACLDAFTTATGWAIQPKSKQRIKGPEANRASRLGSLFQCDWELVESQPIDSITTADDLLALPMVSLSDAEALLKTIQNLVARLDQAENTIRRQEAELATTVAVSWRTHEQEEMADRLEAILRGAGEAIGATAAAMYLLDETTSHLKMRSCWGLSPTRLSDPARPLRGSLGDLEALLGNAVLLEDIALVPEWKSPEKFGSAICVPIGSPTMPHGTLWFWSDTPRQHNNAEIEVANLASSRLMSELERAVLGEEVRRSREVQKQLDAAGLAQASRLPTSQPLHRDFQVDGWTFQDGALGGGFHDWDVTPKGHMVFAVGQAMRTGPEGAIVTATLQSVLKSSWPQSPLPCKLMQSINDVLWGSLETDWSASACLIQINPETNHGSLCNAGSTQAFIISHRGFRPIGQPGPLLSRQPDPTFMSHRFILQPGEILIAFSGTVVDLPKSKSSKKQKKLAMSQDLLLQAVRSMIDESASDLAGHLARMLPTTVSHAPMGVDRSLLVVRNIRKV